MRQRPTSVLLRFIATTLRVKTAPIINLCQQLTTAFAAFLFARKILMRKLITYRHSKGFYIYDNLLHGGELAGHSGVLAVDRRGVPPQGTTAVLLASSQVDWFGPFPSSDMFGQMGLAQSTHLKYMLYNGWAIVVANIILFALLFQILV